MGTSRTSPKPFSTRTPSPRATHRTVPKSLFDIEALQYIKDDRTRKHGEQCEVIIGFDFGTSTTKVIIQAPDLQGSPGFAVDFGRFSHPNHPHFLPSRIWITSDDRYSLEPVSESRRIGDLKLNLFSKPGLWPDNRPGRNLGGNPVAAATAFLALGLRYSRQWLLKMKHDLFGYFDQIVWSVNLGVPSPCVEDNPEQVLFRQVGQAAWMLSTQPHNKLTLNRIVAELEQAREPDYWDETNHQACDFEIIPEIAAGAVGYAMSDLRREGLHLMIDVGASTVDVCSFVLHAPEGSDRYSLLIADVRMVGALRVHFERIIALQKMIDVQALRLCDEHDPSEPFSESVEPYLPCVNAMRAEMKEAEARLEGECRSIIRRVIWLTKLRRDPNASVWKKARLPILLIGGGCRLPFYANVLTHLNTWLQSYVQNHGAQFLEVPVPESLRQRMTGYHRMVVAWGLSHRALDIGDITPADKIEDVEPLDFETKVPDYIGKEQV
ncbi:hypothetical protein [Desulfonatronum thioautotrophicum]|uniref:hypothetical protein n=1 Tax=Desulfonatronum thioautotrophicum TaxID=617001 RepID=UPI0012948664|nr:hypothetical protein [Desulfonatronum thioautotrophicum]